MHLVGYLYEDYHDARSLDFCSFVRAVYYQSQLLVTQYTLLASLQLTVCRLRSK